MTGTARTTSVANERAIDEGEGPTPDRPLVSYVVATYNRPDDLAESVESILCQEYEPFEVVIVSNSTDRTSELFEDGGRFDLANVHYHEFSGRMGVPKARNVGYGLARGDVLVTIDDDAVLDSTDATTTVVSTFREHDDVGAVAFQSRDYDSNTVTREEIPDPPAFDTPPSEPYRATSFIGVGNAIRRRALELAGGYPDDFVYGFEEMDLSLRILDAGYDVLYVPSIVVRHKRSPEGRRTDIETKEHLVENRLRLAIRNLPWRYVLFTVLIWSAYAVVVTRRVSSLGRIYARLYDRRTDLLAERSVVDGETIETVKSRNATLFLWWYGPHPLRIVGPHGNVERLKWEF